MNDLPKLEKSDELVEALRSLRTLRAECLVEGMDEKHFDKIMTAVRAADAEIVAAIHEYRIGELSPYFPESFQAEEDGYEAAEKWMRAKLPEERDL